MIITRMGLTIRLAVSQFRIMGRATQGVRLINLRENDAIAAVAKVPKSTENEEYPENEVTAEKNESAENGNEME